MKPVRAFLLVCALVSSTLPSASQTAGAGEVDSYVKAEMARECIPGLALGVYRQGQIVKAQGYGLANIELNVLVKPVHYVFGFYSYKRSIDMKAILWIGSVLALLAGLVGLGMAFFGNTVETAQGISILGTDFVAILLLALIQGVMDVRTQLKTPPVERVSGK